MWSYAQTREEPNKVLSWKDFDKADPIFATESITLHVAAYLRHMLEKYEEPEFVKYLIAPSPSALTGYFRCDEEEVYAALNELKRQGYEYEAAGNTGPIVLWDPLIRQKSAETSNSWTHWSLSGFNSA
jgi:hypothetical protein